MIYFRFVFIFLFLLTTFNCIGQRVSDDDLKRFSKKIRKEITGVVIDQSTGIKGRGVISFGRKLIFQYDVPENWYPFDDYKQVLVKNLIDNGNEKMYINGEIDLGYYYYKNNKLIKSISIDWEEFDKLRFTLGEFIELTNHPKSNGLEIKLKRPLGWEVKEGDGPHIVKKFVNEQKIYLMYVKEIGQFFSKDEVNSFFKNDSDVKEFILGMIGKNEDDFKLKKHKVVTIENHPFLYFSDSEKKERMGKEFEIISHYWVSFLEDQMIYFMGSSLSNEDYYNEFYKITNSIKLLNQY